MKLFTRFCVFFIPLYFVFILINAWCGKVVYDDIYRLFLEFCFYILVKSQRKYHCQWAKYLALNVFITETFTYIDGLFNFIPNVYIFLGLISFMWVLAITISIYKGIKHFSAVNRLKRIRYEQNNRVN